jgi:predicted ABC-type ATPase
LAKIYIIAGPPGVGKSTSGSSVVPNGLTILDPDQIANRYKTQGFSDYKDIGNLRLMSW